MHFTHWSHFNKLSTPFCFTPNKALLPNKQKYWRPPRMNDPTEPVSVEPDPFELMHENDHPPNQPTSPPAAPVHTRSGRISRPPTNPDYVYDPVNLALPLSSCEKYRIQNRTRARMATGGPQQLHDRPPDWPQAFHADGETFFWSRPLGDFVTAHGVRYGKDSYPFFALPAAFPAQVMNARPDQFVRPPAVVRMDTSGPPSSSASAFPCK